MKALITVLAFVLAACPAYSESYHVSSTGLDKNPGTKVLPFKTISAASSIAEPGDTIIVHEGVYRERINPPRGGSSNEMRIAYQAAAGDTVVIKGSEIVKGWKKLKDNTWQVSIPNSLFGNFNPFDDLIRGDWFIRKDRDHHTGAVYLNGHWLAEAAKREDVFKKGSEPF
jgi:alpha-N-arabinofuranosidase